MTKKIYIIVTIILLILFLYISLFGRTYQDDKIPLEDFIFENISNYTGIVQKFEYVNGSTFNTNYIIIQKVENNRIVTFSSELPLPEPPFSEIKVSILKFNDKGEILERYISGYEIIDNNTLKVSADFTQGYNAIVINYHLFKNKKTQKNKNDFQFILGWQLSKDLLFRGTYIEVPTPKSNNLRIRTIGFISDDSEQNYLPPSDIDVKDNSFTIKFLLLNSISSTKLNVGSVETKFDDKEHIVQLDTSFEYDTITSYDLMSAVFTSFIITIVLGFIFFWLEWRKFSNEKKE